LRLLVPPDLPVPVRLLDLLDPPVLALLMVLPVLVRPLDLVVLVLPRVLGFLPALARPPALVAPPVQSRLLLPPDPPTLAVLPDPPGPALLLALLVQEGPAVPEVRGSPDSRAGFQCKAVGQPLPDWQSRSGKRRDQSPQNGQTLV